jgi:uncharacterized paraquat-inducible protein A
MMPVFTRFNRRMARADAIALVNRGHDYAVHAAQPDGVTACGMFLRFPVELDHKTTRVSCKRCLTTLHKQAQQPAS